MADRVRFSGLHLNLKEITDHYSDAESGLRQYFSFSSAYLPRFVGYTHTEILEELELRLAEENHSGALTANNTSFVGSCISNGLPWKSLCKKEGPSLSGTSGFTQEKEQSCVFRGRHIGRVA